MLRLCLQEQPLREQQPAQQPGRKTKRFPVFSGSCKCKLMHYLQGTRKAASHTSPPFPAPGFLVPWRRAVCSGQAAGLGWGGSSGEPRACLGKPGGNSIKKGAWGEKKST